MRTELERAQRSGELTKASEIQYGSIPELEKKLADRTAKSAQDVKNVCYAKKSPRKTSPRSSRLDAHSRLADARRRTREAGEDGGAFAAARRRAEGSDQGRVQCRAPCAQRFAGPESAHRLIHFSRADRRGQDRDGPRARGISCSTTRTR